MSMYLGTDNAASSDLLSSVTLPSFSVSPGLLGLGVAVLGLAWAASSTQKTIRRASSKRKARKERIKGLESELKAAKKARGFFG